MTVPAETLRALAPQGVLRASINLGNPILAGVDAQGAPKGVSVELAHAFAQRLGVGLELVVFDTASKSVEAVRAEQADIGFFAIDPLRGEGIAFTAPYVLIEGSYLVRTDSPLQTNEAVDQPGRTVTVGQGSAYDLFLTRELKHATIERAPTSPAVVDTFITHGPRQGKDGGTVLGGDGQAILTRGRRGRQGERAHIRQRGTGVCQDLVDGHRAAERETGGGGCPGN
eukprot:gene41323-51165_t